MVNIQLECSTMPEREHLDCMSIEYDASRYRLFTAHSLCQLVLLNDTFGDSFNPGIHNSDASQSLDCRILTGSICT